MPALPLFAQSAGYPLRQHWSATVDGCVHDPGIDMAESTISALLADVPIPASWLDRPISRAQALISWLAGTLIFVGIVALTGGPAYNDNIESSYSAWAIA